MLSRFWSRSFRAVQPRRHRPQIELLEARVVPATFFAATTGNDGNPGTAAAPFRTIQAGVNAAAAIADGNDVVNVAAGTYATPGVDQAIAIPNTANLTNLQVLGGFD